MNYIITARQIQHILKIKPGTIISMALNLGLDSVSIRHSGTDIFIGDINIPYAGFQKIRLEPDALYLVDERYKDIEKIQLYSEKTGQFYRLVNCGDDLPATVEISGIKMHVTKNQNPFIDTQKKANSLSNLHGNILDTCCGLGYTAIYAAQNSKVYSVTTIEIDDQMQLMCKFNPHSRPLFSNKKIRILMGDAAEKIQTFPDQEFNFIFHDPPRYALAPQLYTVHFYKDLHRILSGKGELYHYTGDPNKGIRKKSLQAKTIERLTTAGFSVAKPVYQGVWTRK